MSNKLQVPSNKQILKNKLPTIFEFLDFTKIRITTPFKQKDFDIDLIKKDFIIDLIDLKIVPNKKNIKFSSSGGKIDYVITIDVDTPRKLDYIYSENQDLFKTKKIINIDRHITNTYFGEVNFVKKSAL